MRVACLQTDIAWEDRASNHAAARSLLDGAALPPGSLAVLPEMFATGFSMETDRVAEAPGGETERFLAEEARKRGAALLAGVASRGVDGRPRNEAVAVSPEGIVLARYAKLHLFSPAGEAGRYAAGEGVTVFPWAGFSVAPFLCYDLRFPEVFRAAARRGATLLAVLANWPEERIDHWSALLAARAIENQAYVVGVNRCGRSPHHAYPGRSLILDPRGRVLQEADSRPGWIAADLDPAAVSDWRREFPALRDMRGDGTDP